MAAPLDFLQRMAYLMDFSGDLYGEVAVVQFVAFLRSERQFAGLDELKDQLQVDIAHARAAVATHLQ